MREFIAAVAIALTLLVSRASGDEPRKLAPGTPPLPPGFAIEKMADAKEAAKAADWLEKEYAGKPTEAARMLIAILRGMKADGSNGWFGPAESRYSWAWLAKYHGLDAKAAALPKKLFRGSEALFDQLDRDGDGSIAPADLDWSDKSPYVQQAAAITRIFRRMDGNTDGELTRAELDAFFQRAGNGKDSITADDLRRFLIPRGPRGFAPGDAPSVTVLLQGFFASDIGSPSDGPHLLDPAPTFPLAPVKGLNDMNFSKLLRKKPLVLSLANFT